MTSNRRTAAATATPLAIALLILAACRSSAAGGPPEIVIDQTACSHCGMLISEPVYAAAYRTPDAESRVFDDIGCLLDAARKETATDIRFWFHDASDARWIEGEPAAFVRSSNIRTPMGGGVLAYRDRAAANNGAGAHHGEVVRSVSELLNRSGGSR